MELQLKLLIIVALAVFIVSLPQVYDITNALLSKIMPTVENGKPTMFGIVLHALVASLLVWLLNSVANMIM